MTEVHLKEEKDPFYWKTLEHKGIKQLQVSLGQKWGNISNHDSKLLNNLSLRLPGTHVNKQKATPTFG